jgi:hypothetical protein
MKTLLFGLALFLGLPGTAFPQAPAPTLAPKSTASPTPAPNPSVSPTPPMSIRKALRAKPQPTPYQFPDAHTRRSRYLNSIIGPSAIIEDVGLAGIMTWGKSPPEWGTHWEGFGRRVASNFGWGVIKNSTIFGLDEALGLDSYYYRSTKKDIASRVGNALISSFTARTKSGRQTIGVPRLLGTYLAPVIVTEAWYPQRYSWKDGLRAGSYDLAFNIGYRLAKELFGKK